MRHTVPRRTRESIGLYQGPTGGLQRPLDYLCSDGLDGADGGERPGIIGKRLKGHHIHNHKILRLQYEYLLLTYQARTVP